MNRLLLAAMLFISMSSTVGAETAVPTEQAATPDPGVVIARVGDQAITMNLINTMLNSSAVVGLSIPALGTPERDRVRIQLLDKAISANLFYLDALKQGVDKDPAYQADLQRFSDSLLAMMYRKQVLGEIEITDAEVQAFFENNIAPGTELTDEVRTAIRAKLRKQRLEGMNVTLQVRLREGVEVQIHEDHLDPEADEGRADDLVVATIDDKPVLWGEVRKVLGNPVNAGSMGRRLQALNRNIDHRILAQKGRAAGLEQDPTYAKRLAEFRKTRLINLHRGKLVEAMVPTEEQLAEYFNQNQDRITVKEARKVQMVVLESEGEAQTIKQQIESGEMTMYEAALEHSIDPNAKQTLGEIGWVYEGTGFPELDKVTFVLGPNELGGAVESPAGWHLVRVLDVRDAQYESLDDPGARKLTRRMMVHEQLNDYVVGLRKNEFPVEVYQDRINDYARAEATWMAAKLEKAGSTGEGEQKLRQQIEGLMMQE